MGRSVAVRTVQYIRTKAEIDGLGMGWGVGRDDRDEAMTVSSETDLTTRKQVNKERVHTPHCPYMYPYNHKYIQEARNMITK